MKSKLKFGLYVLGFATVAFSFFSCQSFSKKNFGSETATTMSPRTPGAENADDTVRDSSFYSPKNCQDAKIRFQKLGEVLQSKFGKERVHIQRSKVEYTAHPNVPDQLKSGYDDLGIDSIYVKPLNSNDKENLIIMTAGLHGVEYVAGSIFQQVLVNECLNDKNKAEDLFRMASTGFLIIGTINEYGACNNRRFNGRNVDLNRNCFDHRKPTFAGATIQNKEFDSFWGLMKNNTCTNTEIFAKLALFTKLGFKTDRVEKALSGQYQTPDGIYYGGTVVEPECRIVQDLMIELVPQFKNVLFADVHTGLGETKGLNQIMTNPVNPNGGSCAKKIFETENKIVESMFPSEECQGICNRGTVGHSLETNGDITTFLTELATKQDCAEQGAVVSFTSEIAAADGRTNITNLIKENCYNNKCLNGKCNIDSLMSARNSLAEGFAPTDKKWGDQVVVAGRQMCSAISKFVNAAKN